MLPRTPDTRDPNATRDALLQAGTDLFGRLGFDGARVDAIARRAGVNKAMISYHFGGKQGLYEAILKGTIGTVEDRLVGLGSSRESADVRLRKFVEAFVQAVNGRPAFPAMMVRELLAGGERIDRETLSKIVGVFRLVQEIVRQGGEEGIFRPVDPLLTHLSLVGSLIFFFATARARSRILALGGIAAQGEETDPMRYAQHIQDLFIHGLGGRSAVPQPPPSGDYDA